MIKVDSLVPLTAKVGSEQTPREGCYGRPSHTQKIR